MTSAGSPLYDIVFVGPNPGAMLDLGIVHGEPPILGLRNRSKRYLRLELFAAAHPDPAAWSREPLPSAMDAMDDDWRASSFSALVGVRQLVSAQEGLVNTVLSAGEGAGTKSVPLDPYLVRYRLEIVGPSRRDAAAAGVPSWYLTPQVEQLGQPPVIVYRRLELLTLVTQVVLPVIMGGMPRVAGARFDARIPIGAGSITFGAVWSLVDLAMNLYTSNATEGQSIVFFVVGKIAAWIEEPFSAPAGAARALVQAILGELVGDASSIVLARLSAFVAAVEIGALAGDVAYAVYSWYEQEPIYNALIEAPRTRTRLLVEPPLGMQTGSRAPLDLTVAWLRFATLASSWSDVGEDVVLDSSLRWVARATVDAGGARITLSEIASSSGGGTVVPQPITVIIELDGVASNGEPILEPDPWNAALRDGGLLDFVPALTPFLHARHAGVARLRVRVRNDDPLFAPGPDAAERWAEVTFPVRVTQQFGFMDVAPLRLHVGQSGHPRISVTLGDGRAFASDALFGGDVAPVDASLRLDDLSVPATSVASPEGGDIPLPFSIAIVPRTGDVVLQPPEPATTGGDGRFLFEGLGSYLRARRPGRAFVDVFLSFTSPDYVVHGNATAIVDIEAVDLVMSFLAKPGGDTLRVASDYDRSTNTLFGSVRLRVETTLGEVLYDSDEPAYLTGQAYRNHLRVTAIRARDDSGAFRRLPFGFELTTDSPYFAFADATGGEFQWFDTLDRCLSAMAPGSGAVTARLIDVPDDAELDAIFTLPPSQAINVIVEEELEIELTGWQDEWGMSDLSPSPEIVSGFGTLTGQLSGYRAGDPRQYLTVDGTAVDGTELPLYNVFGPGDGLPYGLGTVAADGSISVQLSQLEGMAPTTGPVTIRVHAWSPIHAVMHGADSRGSTAMARLLAVEPVAVEITSRPLPTDVYDPNIGTVRIAAQRATTLAVVAEPPLAAPREVPCEPSEGLGTLADVTLAATHGRHVVYAEARNAFASRRSTGVLFTAHLPDVELHGEFLPVKANGEAGRRHHRMPEIWGHSSVGGRALVGVRGARELWVREGGSSGIERQAATYASTDEQETDLRVPLDPGAELVVGQNAFVVRAENGFGSSTMVLSATRRPNLYEGGSVFFGFAVTNPNGEPEGNTTEWMSLQWLTEPPPGRSPSEVAKRYNVTYLPQVHEGASEAEVDAGWRFFLGPIDNSGEPVDALYHLWASTYMVSPEAGEAAFVWAPDAAAIRASPTPTIPNVQVGTQLAPNYYIQVTLDSAYRHHWPDGTPVICPYFYIPVEGSQWP